MPLAKPAMALTPASGKSFIGNVKLFDLDPTRSRARARWEKEYQRVMDKKYKKGTRNYRIPKGTPPKPIKNPPIFIVPRVRGGPSYKSVPLIWKNRELDPAHVFYGAISKGYGMQDVSSFTLGPVPGHGLCIVNAAFSKAICPFHLEGGGKLNLARKGYWQPSRNPERSIEIVSPLGGGQGVISVDGDEHDTIEWLQDNAELWYPEWKKWSQAIAVSSLGSFHWDRDEEPVAFYSITDDEYMDFVEWKQKCYISPACQLFKDNRVIRDLQALRAKGWPLGLVHPKGREGQEEPLTAEYIKELYDDPDSMCCMPYVVAGYLLGVKV